jgi:hypothetical protein
VVTVSCSSVQAVYSSHSIFVGEGCYAIKAMVQLTGSKVVDKIYAHQAVPCELCKQDVKLRDMRNHVGSHILHSFRPSREGEPDDATRKLLGMVRLFILMQLGEYSVQHRLEQTLVDFAVLTQHTRVDARHSLLSTARERR